MQLVHRGRSCDATSLSLSLSLGDRYEEPCTSLKFCQTVSKRDSVSHSRISNKYRNNYETMNTAMKSCVVFLVLPAPESSLLVVVLVLGTGALGRRNS